MDKKFYPFLLLYFLTAVHCTASISLSLCSKSSTLLQTHLFLYFLLGTKELIIPKSLIMKELCSRRLENKANFSMHDSNGSSLLFLSSGSSFTHHKFPQSCNTRIKGAIGNRVIGCLTTSAICTACSQFRHGMTTK